MGHSKHARTLLEKYYIGEYVGGPSSLPAKAAKGAKGASAASGNPNAGARLLQLLMPLVVILLALAVFYVNGGAAAK